jgi:hypothetical protein
MAPAGVQRYKPFAVHFHMSIDSAHNTRAQAEKRERLLIEQLQSRGPGGYNCLPGAPSSSRQYWAMQQARTMAQANKRWFG